MVQNLKIDIIYYDTQSDFEFEFNLGGCCHSRILNSRTSSPKEMLSSLSKAVGRSRVILILGKLTEEDGLFNLISKAIGIPLEDTDVNEYGITYPSSPKIISGSLPLVSKDGALSGCIIESGPQSIILLPENKSLRKDISESLVFQYITALSRTPEIENDLIPQEKESDEVIAEETVEAEEKEETTEEISETEEGEAEEQIGNEAESAEETENDFVLEIGAANQENEDDEDIDIPLEAEQDPTPDMDDEYLYTQKNNTKKSIFAADDDTYEEFEEDIRKPKTNKPLSKITVAILVLCGLLLILAAVVVYFLVYTPLTSGIPIGEYIKQVFNFG